jgi:hypothetical protein
LIKAKDQLAAEKWNKKLARATKQQARKNALELRASSVLHRRIKRLRKKELKSVAVNDIGAAHLNVSIPDPEAVAKTLIEEDSKILGAIPPILEGFKAGDPLNWQQQLLPEEEAIPYTELSKRWLQDDFVGFEDESDDDSSSHASEDSIMFNM